MEPTTKTQLEKFKRAARELETDDDEQHFKDRLAKLVKPKVEASGELRVHLLADATPPWPIDTVLLDHEPEVGERITVHDREWKVVANRHTLSNPSSLFADLDHWAICEPV